MSSSPLRAVPPSSPRDRRRIPAVMAASAMVLGGVAAWSPAAQAASVTSAVFSGTGTFTAADGTVYAKQGTAVTLTVRTDAEAKCVTLSGAVSARLLGSSPFVFSLAAGAGNGLQSIQVQAGNNSNANSCSSQVDTRTVGYRLDNTAPTATGVLSPAPNGAGWNKSDVAVTWTGSDVGGSGVRNVTPVSETVTADGIVTRTASVVDNVGNTGSASVEVKLDKTAPAIVGSRTPAANANGWNNTDVTVSFTPTDSLSGVKASTPATTLSASGADQSVVGTVTDNADNTASTTVGGINIDKVAPTLSGKPATGPNAAGWYRGDVAIEWTATDALSGTTNPADSTITGEGTGLTATTSVTDRAGNGSGSVQSTPAVRIDRTAPTTSVTAPPAWNKSDVTLTLVANDGLSGVDQTFYRLDGGAQTAGTSVPVTAEGEHTLTFWSTDAAGNTETAHTVRFGIDRTSPTIGHSQNPAPNGDGWNNENVTVTFTCSDALSGVKSCTGPQTVTTEGLAQSVVGTVEDNAGNTATDPATVSIDKTKPVITVDPLSAPNAAGWYANEVTATFTATDALSGVKTQDRAHTFGEGKDQTVTATATDTAGNSNSVATSSVNVDTTAPMITGAVLGTPNANGWFSGDVTVRWTCSDNLSGVVACPADTVVTGEGDDRSASASVTDRAGHTASATVDGIRIDRTAPSTSASDVPGGWVGSPVTVALSADDNLSGVDATYYSVDGADTPTRGDTVTIGTQGVHTVSYWSVDEAGHRETAKSFTVRLDLTAPSISSSQDPVPNDDGWNNTDVAVSFSCADQVALSGLASCTPSQTLTSEGRAQQVTGTATDHAGNATSSTATVNIDKSAPTITGAPDRAANEAGWYRDPVTVTFEGADALSGIDTVTGPQQLGEGADQKADGTATDNAGNSASTSVAGINVDMTAPTLSAAPKADPNMNDWFNTDVTLEWEASDALSGLAGDVPADAVLSAEGEGQTVSASIADIAGNTTHATSAPIRIDRTAPLTQVSAPTGWVNGSATVTFTATDALSGVSSTHYRLDGGPDTIGSEVTLTSEGTHTIDYFSGDRAGNREEARRVTVQIDRSKPTISHTLDPKANANGWNNADVTVTFTCDDQSDLSGIASCTAPQEVTTEGEDQPVLGTATDRAGNSATDTASVSLDRTAPTIAGHRSPAANGYGWNNTDVTVGFTGDDALSGVASVTPSRTVGEGTDQSVEGTAVDAADNSASTTVGGINVDQTDPALSGKPTTAANGNGWYKGDVTIGWTAGDDRSGVVSTPANSTVTGEGANLKDTATVFDKAGNSTTADSATVKIDRTAPSTGADAPTGWNNTAVTVSLSASDGLSGVEATYYKIGAADPVRGTFLTINTQGVHTLTYWSVDEAGNTEAAQTATVKIDLTRPTITHTVTPAPNSAGWNNSAAKVAYQCTDALSGVGSCSPPVEVTTDGRDQVVPGTAIDNAGNSEIDDAKVSIDTVKPTITGAPDRAANSNDWYAGDVTVTYTCDDALSGIADCTSPAKLSEGKAQNAKGTATDAAGNTDDVTVGPISVDKTAPALSGAPTTGPGADGWYKSDVTITWTADDALSGIDGAAPANSIVDGEGTGLTAGASVRDLAGNETSATSAPVKIDRTAPTTTVSDVSDWSNSAVTVSLKAGDNLSGVATTSYQLDTGPEESGTSVTIDTEGVHTLKVWSVDVAGNVEAWKNVEVRIDKTAPGISHAQAPAANSRSWNNTDVTVTFTCTDTGADTGTGSGIASCTAPQTVTTEGENQPVLGKAVDRAGNSSTDPATVSIDKTAPTVAGSLSAAANAYDWFNANVTVTFTCADQDGLSGVLSCPGQRTLGEGEGQQVTGVATDAADNVSTPATISGINVDKTHPTLSGAVITAANDNGWFKGDVAVTWSASDALSGLDGRVPADSTVTGEGDSLSVVASVKDKAGNTKAATVGGIKIDRTRPSTTATAPSTWQRGDVTVTFAATDNLSGVASTHYTVDGGEPQTGTKVVVATDGTHEVAFWSVDVAGNVEVSKALRVLVDNGLPTITGKATTDPNPAGWYKAPVTVEFTCDDALSGIASCQPKTTVAAEGANAAIGTAVDHAGNEATTTVAGINIDTVAPVVTIAGIANGAQYTIGAVPAATASATDATSGLAGPATATTTGGTNGVGTFTYTATATDKAGNVGTASVTYTVVYGFGTTLFLQPVNDTAHQTGVSTSVFNAGQTIPMKFELRNASGQVIQAGSAPKWLTPVKGNATNAAVNESAYTATPSFGGVYALNGSQYQYNWKTEKSMAGFYWRVGVTLDDGKTYSVNIALR